MCAYLFLSKVAILTQSYSLSAIFSYVDFCLKLVKIFGIAVSAGIADSLTIAVIAGVAVIAGIAVFARLQRLNVIISLASEARPQREGEWKTSYCRAC